MRVLLTSHGSTGDIIPMIALGCALRAAGHEVTFATTAFFQQDIEAAGLGFVRLPPDWNGADFADAMKDLHRAKTPLRQLRLIYSSAKPFLAEALEILSEQITHADLLVGSYLFPSFKGLADKHGKPFAVVSFCHNTVASPDYPPDGVPSLVFLPKGVQRLWNCFFWKVAQHVLDGVMEKELGDVLSQADLPMQRGFCFQPANLALVAVSPTLMKKNQAEYPECFQFCGYLRYQGPEDPDLEQTLLPFTQGNKVPVVTFGSVTYDRAQSEMERFLENYPRNEKLILQAGWADFDPAERSNILLVGKCSHDQLFRHASAILHHGGAGTTASALHAGVPQLVAPQIADQNFWSQQVMRLGVGMRASPRAWAEHAPRLLKKLSTESHFTDRAQDCARVLKQEKGGEHAVRTLEALVAQGTS